MRRKIGNRVVRWLVVAAMCALPVQGFAGNVGTRDIVNGAITTPKIADGAVTAAKLGIVCPDGQYLKYTAGSGWACNGDTGLTGPQGATGEQGVKGDTGAQGPVGPMAHYANVIVVAKSGGDFTDPIAAVNSISDASTTNSYLIKLMPGSYNLQGNKLYMKEFVYIEGSGQNFTNINGDIYWGTNNTSIENISLISENIAILGYGDVKLKNVTIDALNGISAVRGKVYLENCKMLLTRVSGSGIHQPVGNESEVIIKNTDFIATAGAGVNIVATRAHTEIDNSRIDVNLENVPNSGAVLIDAVDISINNDAVAKK